MHTTDVHTEAIAFLQQLIATPSFSREEDKTADILDKVLQSRNIETYRKGNNVWAKNKYWQKGLPILLLNSHHDTVKPVKGWQRDPFEPTIENGSLFGLGSNDAGASLISLMMSFIHFFDHTDLAFNLIFAATAEEEISGPNGIAHILEELGSIDLAIVGEPTQMRMAIAEKGLMVIDGEAQGKAGHAAREEGINALYIALEDINKIRNYQFEKSSALLGPTKMTVTQIECGTQHNVVPDRCRFVVDVRTNEHYSNQDVFHILQELVQSSLKARSFRLNSSGIALEHPFVQAGLACGLDYYGSPTLSDQALIPFTSIKIGPGKSARSHTADEFIRLDEIEQGIQTYIHLLEAYSEALRKLH